MLTQIEIDGFKTFKDFKVELAPFQVIVGPNGSGKSNLFDALHLLSRLADTDLRSAFQDLRGTPDELFMLLPNGKRVDSIRFAIEMLVDKKVKDDLGQEADVKYTRLRYELAVTFRTDEYGLEQPLILYESLKAVPREHDSWCKKYTLTTENGWLPPVEESARTFIDTDFEYKSSHESDKMHDLSSKTPLIHLYPDGNLVELIRSFATPGLQRTILSVGLGGGKDYSHVFAAREELRSLRFLHLNPEELRKSGSIKAPTILSYEGKNLPAMLMRMQMEDKFALTDVSRDMANLVPGIIRIRVEKNAARNEYDVWADTSDHKSFSAQVLSDGTLRLLALATIRNDPHFHGIFCLEEPENGVHPLHLSTMAQILHEMATNFDDPQQVNEPLRQVLITTHSPLFISQPHVIDSLLLAFTPTRVKVEDATSVRVTRMEPVVTPNNQAQLSIANGEDKSLEVYAIDTVRKYLEGDDIDRASEQLNKARTTL